MAEEMLGHCAGHWQLPVVINFNFATGLEGNTEHPTMSKLVRIAQVQCNLTSAGTNKETK